MDYKEIQNLIKLINDSNIAEFKLSNDDIDLTIRTKDYHRKTVFAQTSNAAFSAPAPVIQHHQESSGVQVVKNANEETPIIKTAEAKPKGEFKEVKSPIVGTFYRSPSPDKDPYVKIGDHVDEKSVVCIVEAMKLFNEIEAETTGKIVEILVEDGSPVEYDQVLFLVDTKG